MKKIYFTILIISFTILSCRHSINPYKKPFIITGKSECNKREAYFTYSDAQGNSTSFFDLCDKYSIGDTLK